MQSLDPKLGDNPKLCDKMLISNLQAHLDEKVLTKSLQPPTSNGRYLTTKKTNKTHLVTKS